MGREGEGGKGRKEGDREGGREGRRLNGGEEEIRHTNPSLLLAPPRIIVIRIKSELELKVICSLITY